MKFSVLMSVYAKEKPEYLKEALQSLIDQTLLPNEIVVVRDGRLTSDLDGVIEEFVNLPVHGRLFRIISLDKNVGLGIALNAGIKACSHEIIARADSDDVSLPDRFRVQLRYMQENGDVNLISAPIVEFDEKLESRIAEREVPASHDEILKYIKRRNPFNHMAVMYRKSSVVRAGGYRHCPYFEDYYLWLRMAAQGGSFANIKIPLVHARAGDGMIARRGGFAYARHIASFYRTAFGDSLIPIGDVLCVAPVRLVVSIMPEFLRLAVYRTLLRGEG